MQLTRICSIRAVSIVDDYDYRYADFFNPGNFVDANSFSEIVTDEVSLQIDYTVTERALLTLGGLYRNDELRMESANL